MSTSLPSRPTPPLPPNEEERLSVVRSLCPQGGLGDGAPEDATLQTICKTICTLFQVPIAGVSLVQKDAYSMRACQGLPSQLRDPRRDAFCAWTLVRPCNTALATSMAELVLGHMSVEAKFMLLVSYQDHVGCQTYVDSCVQLSAVPETMVVEDLSKDHRFSGHPRVLKTPGGLRFYAGSPLITGTTHRVGTLCIMDTAPRKLAAEEFNLLNNFAELASRRLEEKHLADLKRHSQGQLLRSPRDVSEAVLLCDLSNSRSNSRWWTGLYANPAFSELAGRSMMKCCEAAFCMDGSFKAFSHGSSLSAAIWLRLSEVVESSFWKLFRPANNEAKNKVLGRLEPLISAGKGFALQACTRESTLDEAGDKDVFEMQFRPATKQFLGAPGTHISVPNFVAGFEPGAEGFSINYYFASVVKGNQNEAPIQEEVSAKNKRQQTFYSQEFSQNNPVTSKQPLDEGIADVQIGVLSDQTGDSPTFRGRWRRRPVSVKVFEAKHIDCVRGPAFGAAYVPKEAALTMDLEHPNVISTYKVVVENLPAAKSVKAWLVREWGGLGTLRDAIQRGWLLRQDRQSNMRSVLAIAAEVAGAMAYLHEQDIVLGCLTSHSVALVSGEEDRKTNSGIKDFSAKIANFTHAVKTEEPVAIAKLAVTSHSAPEVITKGQVSKASDVYAFGVLWWELCNSQLAWPSLTASQLQRKVASKETLAMPRDAPAGVQALLADSLAFKPGQRPSFVDIGHRLGVLAQQDAEHQELTGVDIEAGGQRKSFRPLKERFSPMPRVPSMQDFRSNSRSGSGKKTLEAPPQLLEIASQDVQKKSLFKRFTNKLKVEGLGTPW